MIPGRRFPRGIAAQATRTTGNLARALAALGPGLEHLVSVRVCLCAFERDDAAMKEACAAALPSGGRPVRTCAGVTAPVRGALIEIEAVARRPWGRVHALPHLSPRRFHGAVSSPSSPSRAASCPSRPRRAPRHSVRAWTCVAGPLAQVAALPPGWP